MAHSVAAPAVAEAAVDSRVNFVGFWPWPRAWATREAAALAETLPKKNGVFLARELTPAEAGTFREVAVNHHGKEFEAHLAADGLLAYRHDRYEAAVEEGWERVQSAPALGFPASTAAWNHYTSALSILFLLLESGMHTEGRNNYLYWVEPVGRTRVVRVRYNPAGQPLSQTSFGPETEMNLARVDGPTSVDLPVGGRFSPDPVAAFQSAMPVFDRAHAEPRLWAFLDVFASAWTLRALGQFDSALTLAWFLVERDLVQRVGAVLAQLRVGVDTVMTVDGAEGTPRGLSAKEEHELRTKTAQGESPMAGKLLGVLAGHGQAADQDTKMAKTARDRLAHGGSRVTSREAEAALRGCLQIASRVFQVKLAPRLNENPEIGLTP